METKLSLEQVRDLNEALAGIYQELGNLHRTQNELMKSTHALLEAAKECDPKVESLYSKYFSDGASRTLDELLRSQLSLIELAVQKLRK